MHNQRKKSLTQTHPHLLKEWHPTKNQGLSPDEMTLGMRKEIWWRCQHGHEWQTLLCNRTSQHSNCPYCSGKRLKVGFNDLATTHPHLLNEWHPTKNGELTPQQVTRGLNKKIWWQCQKGHEWEAILLNRAINQNGCPYCSNQRILEGYNDLTTTHPEIAKEWHPTKNETLLPTMVSYGSRKKVWWQCKKGHEWEKPVNNRTTKKSRCPICYPKWLKPGINDLKTKAPQLLNEWHPTKNTSLNPEDLPFGSHQEVWWQCEKGHEWVAEICNRVHGTGCPICQRERKRNTSI